MAAFGPPLPAIDEPPILLLALRPFDDASTALYKRPSLRHRQRDAGLPRPVGPRARRRILDRREQRVGAAGRERRLQADVAVVVLRDDADALVAEMPVAQADAAQTDHARDTTRRVSVTPAPEE